MFTCLIFLFLLLFYIFHLSSIARLCILYLNNLIAAISQTSAVHFPPQFPCTMSSRQYDVVVWGATGYTGGLTAQHIAQSFPTDIQWAVAGRSVSKLQAVVESCAKINPDRSQPCMMNPLRIT